MTTWTYLKTVVDSKGINPQFTESADCYFIKLYDGPSLVGECIINKNINIEEKDDFETNYKNVSNESGTPVPMVMTTGVVGETSDQFDTDKAQIVRIKAAKRGWSFWAVPIEFTTSTIAGTLYCKDSTGVDIPGIGCKIYNGSDVEITTPGLLDANLATCVKTVVDVELPFDYELIGGALRINSNPASDIRLWIVGAPDIPAEYGGSKEFASGINLKFMAPDDSFEVDGRVTKYITYSNVTHSGKIRIILKHPAGTQVNMQIVIHLYRA